MIALSDVRVTRRRHLVLDEVSAVFATGFIGLLGVNGAGKTTLLHTLAGILRPESGSVTLDERDLYGRHSSSVRSRIALVPQELSLPARLTVAEFVTYMAWMRGVPRGSRESRVDDAIEQVDLTGRRSSPLGELSGGMRRRVLIAQALVAEPDVLLLDEPTTGLDPEQRHTVRDIAGRLGRDHLVVMSSHVVEDIGQLADRVLVLSGGRFAFDGTVRDLADLDPDRRGDTEAGFLAVIRAPVA